MLKFRAYHNTEKFMMLNTSQAYEGEVFSWLNEGQDVTITQFIGMLDKFGKEIYVGDIVIAYHNDIEEYERLVVKNIDGVNTLGRYWSDGSHDWHSMEQYDYFELEIVGNIYEGSKWNLK